VAPTLDPEELDKRIQELKTVQFWLEQNTKAVAATIQALEVQRMTLNTLKGMNMSFNDLAESLKVKPQEMAAAEPRYSFTQPAAASEPEPAETPAPAAKPKANKPSRKTSKSADKGVDPAHWWGALTDQFQHIATHAMNDMAHRAQAHAPAGAAPKAAATAQAPAAKKTAAKKPAAKKVVAKKTKR
jgi:hypothetical protein